MNIKVCDRCKKVLPGNIERGKRRIARMELIVNDYTGEYCTNYHVDDIVLCDECSDVFFTLMNVGVKE